MNLYLDTSALVKLYVAEEDSPVVRGAVQTARPGGHLDPRLRGGAGCLCPAAAGRRHVSRGSPADPAGPRTRMGALRAAPGVRASRSVSGPAREAGALARIRRAPPGLGPYPQAAADRAGGVRLLRRAASDSRSSGPPVSPAGVLIGDLSPPAFRRQRGNFPQVRRRGRRPGDGRGLRRSVPHGQDNRQPRLRERSHFRTEAGGGEAARTGPRSSAGTPRCLIRQQTFHACEPVPLPAYRPAHLATRYTT